MSTHGNPQDQAYIAEQKRKRGYSSDDDEDNGEGTPSVKNRTHNALRVVFWNVRNLSNALKRARGGGAYNPDAVGQAVRHFVESGTYDVVFLMEVGEDITEGRKPQNQIIGRTKGYSKILSAATGYEKYMLIFKNELFENFRKSIPKGTNRNRPKNALLLGSDLQVGNARDALYVQMEERIGGNTMKIGFCVIHALSASNGDNRQIVLTAILEKLKEKNVDVLFFCGDFNYKSNEKNDLDDLMDPYGFTYAGPQEGFENTSLKKFYTIEKKLNGKRKEDEDDNTFLNNSIFNQPYDQVWVKTNLDNGDFLSVDRDVQLNGINKEEYLSMFITLGDQKKDSSLKEIVTELSQIQDPKNHEVDGTSLRSNTVATELESLKSAINFLRNNSLLTDLTDRQCMQEFNVFLDSLENYVNNQGNNPIKIKEEEYFRSSLEEIIALLEKGFIDKSDENSFWVPYEYLISDHVPVGFQINITDFVLRLIQGQRKERNFSSDHSDDDQKDEQDQKRQKLDTTDNTMGTMNEKNTASSSSSSGSSRGRQRTQRNRSKDVYGVQVSIKKDQKRKAKIVIKNMSASSGSQPGNDAMQIQETKQ